MLIRHHTPSSGLRASCCVVIAFVHLYVCVTSATKAGTFGRSDNDNIYDILEEEHFVIVDQKLARQSTTTEANLSFSLPKSPYSHPSMKDNSLEVENAAQDTSSSTGHSKKSSPRVPYGGYMLRAGAVHEDVLAPREMEEELLIFSQDRESVEFAEQQQREGTQERAHRVKRQAATVGSGVVAVDAQAHTNVPWNSNFQSSSSQDYLDLEQSVTNSLNGLLDPSTQSFTVTGFESGSTIVLFTVIFTNDILDRVGLAERLNVWESVFYSGTTYDLLEDPTIATDNNLFQAAPCYLCESYQTCVRVTDTNKHVCQISSSFFFAYGVNQDDNIMRKNRQRLTIKENVRESFPVAGQSISSVYISMNGLLSFGRNFNSFSPRRLPRRFRGENRLLLCGYWGDFQLSSTDAKSDVYYHSYIQSGSMSAKTTAMFLDGKNRVELYTGRTDFTPTYMLIATYENIPPSNTYAVTTTQRVNFQMAMITDGLTTYAMIIYASGGMTWDQVASSPVVIGFNQDNFRISTSRPDTNLGSVTNTPGVWFLVVGTQSINYAAECLKWYYNELPNRNTYELITNLLLPRCPCNYQVALISNSYIPYTLRGNTLCFISFSFFGQFGKTCCYRFPGIYLPRGGSFLLTNPVVNARANYVNDILPRRYCCVESDLCDLFFEVRPAGICRRRFNFFRAWAIGDPHINTLDGKSFPFNGIGEYTLLKVDQPDLNFNLQARTCQAVSSTGEPVRASVFCAFVAMGNTSNKVQVELSNSGEAMVLYINGQDLTNAYLAEGNTFSRTVGAELTVTRTNNTLKVYHKSGLFFGVSVSFKLLEFQLSLPPSVNQSVGLLASADGNPENDYAFPNGTLLPTNSSERELFYYGQTWSVNQQTSNFVYPPGRDHASYTNESFVPIFLMEVNQTLVEDAGVICGGSGNIGCVFDYIATGNRDLAQATTDESDRAAAEIITGENSVPELTGPTSINVTLGIPTVITLDASDSDDSQQPEYVIIDQPSSNFTFYNLSQTVEWTPTSNETSRLEFSVVDTQGVNSPALQIQIVQCSGCSNHGNCSFERLQPQTVVDEYFRLCECDCQPYWTGTNCEEDFDACVEEPCPELTTCTDWTPAEHEAAGPDSIGYNCTGCPTGYTLNITDGLPNCLDVDECNDSSPCASVATCTNTLGSFTCTCGPGYRIDTSDMLICVDINECTELTDDCEQLCVNNLGSYSCECLEGFFINTTTKNTCSKDDADPCEGNITCSYACVNDSGLPVCKCPKGFELTANQTSCKDIDECDLSICSQKCANSIRSFACSCYSGFLLDDDKVTCSVCPTDTYGDNCNQTCECRARGTCDSVQGCQCTSGWRGPTCNENVDECDELTDTCSGIQNCIDTNGSFTCVCPSGFFMNGTSCQDIDECENPSLNNCEQKCNNTQGAYVCSCIAGYNYVAANNSCMDINECAKDISGCEQECENFPGSANCLCYAGFMLNDDRKSCTKEVSPCEALSTSKNCSYGCRVINGAAECFCAIGYELAFNQLDCIDVLECASNTTNDCTQACDDTPGSYMCSCTIGYSLANDERTCTVCDGYHWGDDCKTDCDCSPVNTERCDPVTGCICKEGFLRPLCVIDRDDCQSSPCSSNSDCVDTAGSFQCNCLSGYAKENGSSDCTNVDECNPSSSNPCNQNCNDTVGSYTCSCEPGFIADGDKCEDVDECVTKPCDQLCRNNQGGYFCECYPGFLLNTTTRNTCYGETTCNSNNTCTGGCRVVNTIDTCFCPSGYVQNSSDSNLCDDIKECNASSSPCINGSCIESDGGFSCSCDNGTELLDDKITCRGCPEGKYGSACTSLCTCVATNTDLCDAVTGACSCKTGWHGPICSEDVEECDNLTICDSISNSKCKNTNGSYVCQCSEGFFTSGAMCLPCDDSHYGTQCATPCPCIRANTQDCNDLNGTCTCTQFWKGDNCSMDVKECDDNSTCQTAVYEKCVESDGGYSCDCITGYSRKDPSENCTDIDECERTTLNTCNTSFEVCNNIPGNFSCVCKTGYTGTAGSCTDVNECGSSNLNTCNNKQDCTNSAGSYSCPCKSTYTLLNGVCIDINECSSPSSNNCTEKENCVDSVDGNGGYSCVCKGGYFRNTAGSCIPTFMNYTLLIRFDFNATEPLTDPTSPYEGELTAYYYTVLELFFRTSVGIPFHSFIITDLSAGSVNVNSQLQIDSNKTDIYFALAARAIKSMLAVGYININGTDQRVTSITVDNNITVSIPISLCEVYHVLTSCTVPGEVCQVQNTVPVCGPVSSDNTNVKLIIGLGVGIPLFFIVAIVSGCLIFYCIRNRKARSSTASDHRPDASEHRFPSIFAGQLATKGSWGAAQRYHMYSPDNMSVSHGSNSSGEGQLLKGRRQGRSDFQDSAWYDNRGASAVAPSSPRRNDGPAPATDAATSNFSWEYMFRLLAPYRDGFEIQRPNVDPSPNPAFTPRTVGTRPDSMA